MIEEYIGPKMILLSLYFLSVLSGIKKSSSEFLHLGSEQETGEVLLLFTFWIRNQRESILILVSFKNDSHWFHLGKRI